MGKFSKNNIDGDNVIKVKVIMYIWNLENFKNFKIWQEQISIIKVNIKFKKLKYIFKGIRFWILTPNPNIKFQKGGWAWKYNSDKGKFSSRYFWFICCHTLEIQYESIDIP